MKIIVGLGNPDKEYEYTNHNAGFLTIDKIASHYGEKVNKNELEALTCSFHVGGEKIILAKPQTYMNNSGFSVQKLCARYKINPETDLVIISDDIDCESGTIRIRCQTGNTTHNGIKSILHELGTNKFIRVKVSVAPRPEYMKIMDFVLAKIDNQSTFDAIEKASKATIDIIEGLPIQEIMNKYN